MQQGSRQLSIAITRYLVRLPIIDRIKAAKDQAANLLHTIRAELGDLQTTTGTLIANNALLLEAATSLVQIMEQTRDEAQQYSGVALEAVNQLRQGLTRDVQEVRREIRALKALLEAQAVAELLGEDRESRRRPMTPCNSTSDFCGSDFQEPEAALMAHLYSFLPERRAVDVGAHIGDVSRMLLDTGFEVYAFEPNPALFDRLMARLGRRPDFRAFPWALGEADGAGILHTVSVSDMFDADCHRDVTWLSSLVEHPLPDGLVFSDGPEVAVKTLDTLHGAGIIPARVGLVKIDTEGSDLRVVRGMGSHRYPVVVCEYWDPRMPFGGSKDVHSLEDLVNEMRSRDYHWHIVFYRVWGREETRFYCGFSRSLEATYGNVFFFQDFDIFNRAREWCSAIFPQTLLK